MEPNDIGNKKAENTPEAEAQVFQPSGAVPIEAIKEPLREVSAATVGRMLGLATVTELKLLEGKLDLITTKINAVQLKVDRVATAAAGFPSTSDLDRIDVQIGSLKNFIREMFSGIKDPAAASSPFSSATNATAPVAAPGADALKKPRPNIFVSKPADGSTSGAK